MWTDTTVYREDLDSIAGDAQIPFEQLEGRTFLVTGATGLIGQSVVSALLHAGRRCARPPRVVALVRSQEKAERVFAAQLADCGAMLSFAVGDMCGDVQVDGPVDYVIHGASQTSSRAFVETPVETIDTAVLGTRRMLQIAREKRVKAFVYLSSMEVYGYPEKGCAVTEARTAGFDPTRVRSCYPMSKQLCEAMCCAYAQEYGVPARIVRLTQTFGPGVSYEDGRVFAQFLRCVKEGRDIVLQTKGETERSYLYTADAVRAILLVLFCGEDAQAYHAANAESYCSIAQMAQLVAGEIAGGSIGVRIDPQGAGVMGYADTLYMNLDTGKLEALGWKAAVGLKDMYQRTLSAFG